MRKTIADYIVSYNNSNKKLKLEQVIPNRHPRHYLHSPNERDLINQNYLATDMVGISSAELSIISAAAFKDGVPLGDWTRNQLLRSAAKTLPKSPEKLHDYIHDQLRHVLFTTSTKDKPQS